MKREARPRVSMTLDDDVLEVLEEIAEREARTVSEVARIVVTEKIRGRRARLSVERRPRVLDRRGLYAVSSTS